MLWKRPATKTLLWVHIAEKGRSIMERTGKDAFIMEMIVRNTESMNRRNNDPITEEKMRVARRNLIAHLMKSFHVPVPSIYIADCLSATPREAIATMSPNRMAAVLFATPETVDATLYENQDVFSHYKFMLRKKVHTVLCALRRED